MAVVTIVAVVAVGVAVALGGALWFARGERTGALADRATTPPAGSERPAAPPDTGRGFPRPVLFRTGVEDLPTQRATHEQAVAVAAPRDTTIPWAKPLDGKDLRVLFVAPAAAIIVS